MFNLIKKDGKKRRGRIVTDSGIIETPAFIPVSTQATPKALTTQDMKRLDVQVFISNTYHLYLRPGLDIIEHAGGIHRFMDWDRPVFTDSGGFQVLSLAQLREFEEDGVMFQSHIDGSYHKFTPQNNVDMQRRIGSDIMMVLDECTRYPATEEYAREAMDRTIRWAADAREAFVKSKPLYSENQFQFGIIQGSVYKNLRRECALKLVSMDFEGYAMGGVAIGETKENINSIIDMADEIMPQDKPRYLMGVGRLEDIEYAVKRGFDIFDCVVPTRNARNGTLFTDSGRIVITNAQFKDDHSVVDEDCDCTLCTHYTRAYLHHLFRANEIAGLMLATEHNINYYMRFMQSIRENI